MNKKQATSQGQALLKRMNGKGWKLRVWENLGWHYDIYLLGLTVHHPGKNYSTLLSSDPENYSGSGEIYWTPEKSFKDPNKAVEHQMKMARIFSDKCQKMVSDISSLITEKKLQ